MGSSLRWAKRVVGLDASGQEVVELEGRIVTESSSGRVWGFSHAQTKRKEEKGLGLL